MKLLQPFFIAMLAAGPVAAQCPDCSGPLTIMPGAEMPSDGLGAGGVATEFTWKNGFVHLFLATGDNPEPYGAVRVTIPMVINPVSQPRPLCVANGAQTGPEYTPVGYRNLYWPMVTFQTGEYTLNDGTNPTTVNVVWHSADFLQPRTAYSIIVDCAQKVGR